MGSPEGKLPRLKGSGVVHLAGFIKTRFGDEGLERLAGAVGPGAGAMLRVPIATEWYPFRDVVAVEIKAIELFFGGDVTQGALFGRHSLQQSVHKIYRVLFRVLDPAFLIKRSAGLWSTFHDTGSLEVEQTGPRSARLRILDLDPIHEVYCHDFRGSVCQVLDECGQHGWVKHVECRLHGAPWCRFEASW